MKQLQFRAVLARGQVLRVTAKLRRLVRIAADLRDMPREEFKTRLKADIQRRAAMSASSLGFRGQAIQILI